MGTLHFAHPTNCLRGKAGMGATPTLALPHFAREGRGENRNPSCRNHPAQYAAALYALKKELRAWFYSAVAN